MEKLDVIK